MIKNKNKGFISILIAGIIALVSIFSVGTYLNSPENGLNVGGNTITPLPVRNFLGLNDTPDSYSGQGSKTVSVKSDASGLEFTTPASSMVYPGAGIALSTGSAWGTSITDSSANWNTAYGWGNHATAGYLSSLSGALLATGATTGATSSAQPFTLGVKTGKVFPASDSTTALQFLKADGTTNILNIDTTNGRVGIGSTAPTALLEMSKAVSTDIGPVLRLTNAFGGQSSGGQIKFTAGSTQSSIYGTSTTGGEVNGSILTFRTSNTNNSTDVERVRIDHNGNVGIGTGTPGANLDISSGGTEQARFIGTGTGGASLRLNATGTSGENWRVLATASGNGEGAGKLLFQDGSSGNTFLSIVKSSGNVGIGTTAPTALLEMSKAVSTDIGPVLRLTNAFGGQSSGGQIKFTAGSTQSSIYGTSTTGGEVNGSILTFRTSNTNNSTDVERVRIDHNGNVGIGTTGPTAYLQIKAGTATANTAPLKFTSGTLNTTAEAGAVEFLTDAFYGTITTGAARKTFAFLESPSLVTPTANYFLRSVGNALTATGTTRTDALQLAKEINNITTAAAGTGVILPVGVVGMRITIFNAGANLIQVYASASETIDTVAGSTGVPLTNTKRCEYFFTTTNTWISAQLGVISA